MMRVILGEFHQQVRAALPADARLILEAGCGEGFSAREVLDGVPPRQCFGGDLRSEAVIEARRRFPAMQYSVLDVTALPFAANSVDLVMSLEVLEHLPDPAAAVREYARISRRYLLLSVPNDPIFRTLRFLSGRGVRRLGDHPQHIQHWTTASFAAFVEAQGVNILRVIQPAPAVWSVVLGEVGQ